MSTETVTRRQWIAVFGGILGAFMAILDIQITNASLENIVGSLGATLDEGSWVSTSYLVAEIMIIPLTGWLVQVIGLRRYLLWTSTGFLICSVLCACSWNLGSLILFRAMQGFMGGALIPLAFNLILQLLPPSKRVVGFSLFGFASTFAPGIGPSLGGWLTDNFTWISIFYINILPGGIMLAMIAYGMECCPPRWSLLKEGDWWGIATMAVGLGSLTIFLEEGERKDWFGSVLITRLAVIATISLAWFFWHELRVKKPFINLRLIGRRNFGLSCLLNFAVGVALYGSIYLLPVYLAQIQGYSALQIGGVIMWAGLPQLLILPFLNLIQSRFDVRYVVFTGVVIFTISLLMNTVMTHETGLDQLRWSQLLRAIGQPLVMIPITAIATGKIEKEQVGSASGIFNMLRNLGGSVGIALLATMLTQREQFHSVRIGDAVSLWATPTQDRMTELQQQFFNHGVDAVTAQQQAYALLHQIVQRESYVMAFNECFLLIAITLFLSGALILLCEKTQVQGSVAAH